MVTVFQEKMASGIPYKVVGAEVKEIQIPSAYHIWLSSREFIGVQWKIIFLLLTLRYTGLTKMVVECDICFKLFISPRQNTSAS